MSVVMIVLIAVAVITVGFLLYVLIAQIRSSRHIETLKYDLKASGRKQQPEIKPKVMHGATPSKGSASSPAVIEPAPEPVKPVVAVPEETIEAAPEPVAVTIPEPVETEAQEESILEAESLETAEKTPAEATETVFTPYPPYDSTRSIESLGLSEAEAEMFVRELIEQIESEIPTLDAALDAADHENLERVSHMLKGSSTSLGTGGVADVLVAFNTYCKSGKDFEVIAGHLEDLKHYLEALKREYPEEGTA